MEMEEVDGNCEIKLDVQRYFMMVFGITGVKTLDPTAKEYRNQQFIKKNLPRITSNSLHLTHALA